MEFGYKKHDNSELFSSLENNELLNVDNTQNYIPIYNRFFSLTSSNKESINLNNVLSLKDINKKETENKFNGTVFDSSNNIYEKPIFFKLSPLLDPIKYMTGKYDLSNSQLLNLPIYDLSNSHAKVRDVNNAAYVDSFFTYLSSQLLHNHKFYHGVDFFGSFLAHKIDYMVDVADDIEYLFESKPFHKNKNALFYLDNNFHSDILDYDTRNYKKKIIIEECSGNNIQLSDINDIDILDTLFVKTTDTNKDKQPDLLYEETKRTNKVTKSETSSCSSRSSNTNNNNDDISDEEDVSESDDEHSSSLCSDASDDQVFIKFPKFPIQVIALERCSKTLDSLLISKSLSDKEWSSIVIQILMILITYQKVFKLTHNDLHTSNIMYVETDKQFLVYKYNNKYYKVPTFGMIFKIIDYGRAIYKFRGNLICSDSFHPEGDAATQYNFEPYFNEKKPRL
jgi:hypothetical protein